MSQSRIYIPCICRFCDQNLVIKRKYDLGRHLASRSHVSKKQLYANHPERLAEIDEWERLNDRDGALATYLGKERTRHEEYERIRSNYGQSERDMSTPMHGVTSQGILTDANELGSSVDASSHAFSDQMDMSALYANDRSQDSHIPTDSQAHLPDNEDENENENEYYNEDENEDENKDVHEQSNQLENLMLRINRDHNLEAFSAMTIDLDTRGDMDVDSDTEENMAVDLNTENEAENEAEINNPTSEDQTPDQGFGVNDYFSSSPFFTPPENATSLPVDQPADYYPFESKTQALLYLFCNGHTSRYSRRQLDEVWWLLHEFFPSLRLPTIESIMKLRMSLPKPNIRKFQANKAQPPYYQVNTLDLVRMQFGLPGAQLNELPEVVIETKNESHNQWMAESWHGSKWKHNAELQRPQHTLVLGEGPCDVWNGDFLELKPQNGNASLVLFRGVVRCNRRSAGSNNIAARLQCVGLQRHEESRSFRILTRGGRPLINDQTMQLIPVDMVRRVIPHDRLPPIVGFDCESHLPHPLTAEIRDALASQHPLRQYHRTLSGSTPIRLANITLWNDGMSGVRSSRWNPYEVWTLSMAGIPHRQRSVLNSCVFVSAAKDTPATVMIPPLVEELKRLQRGIVAFDANIGQKIFVCGSLVQGVADNPAASALCAHKWQSRFPCRVCLFSPAEVQNWEDVYDVSRMRVLEDTKAHSASETRHGMKDPLTEFYDLAGLDPHLDWSIELLHTLFLGLHKYLLYSTLTHSNVKKNLGKLASVLSAQSYDSVASAHRPSGRRAVKWSGSFVGSDFKFISQFFPAALVAMFRYSSDWDEMRPLVNIWCSAGRITKLLCMHVIPDVKSWTSDFTAALHALLQLWEQLFGLMDLKKKTKLHQLAHVPFWVQRFGPPVAYTAEQNEASNKHVRNQLAFSNRQAGSRDCALRYSAIMGLQYLAQGGVWRTARENTEKMTRAGKEFLTICETDTARTLLGLTTNTPRSREAKVSKPGRKYNGSQLGISTQRLFCQASGDYFSSEASYQSYNRFEPFVASSTSARRGKGSIGSYVHFETPARDKRIWRVKHILRRLENSRTFLAVEECRDLPADPELAPEVGVFERIQDDSCLFLVELKQVTAVLNVQHICDNECQVITVGNAYTAEREDVEGLVLKHSDNGVWMLNPYVL